MKKCVECEKGFKPIFDRQEHCVDCIMALAPEITNTVESHITTDFGEWFIYNWRKIREAAKVEFGVEFGTASEELKKR